MEPVDCWEGDFPTALQPIARKLGPTITSGWATTQAEFQAKCASTVFFAPTLAWEEETLLPDDVVKNGNYSPAIEDDVDCQDLSLISVVQCAIEIIDY